MPSSKTAFFSVLHKRFLNKTRMSTRCLPAETPGAQGLAGFPRRPPSTLPSTHFFAPIPETPVISAKIFEISKNVWGYDIQQIIEHDLLVDNVVPEHDIVQVDFVKQRVQVSALVLARLLRQHQRHAAKGEIVPPSIPFVLSIGSVELLIK
ncbi:MAG: hypothetical protein KIG29_06160 [Oscillospiraceae bacterium]|nr:hypothetical protein [Oscillospiraceae bacterium]